MQQDIIAWSEPSATKYKRTEILKEPRQVPCELVIFVAINHKFMNGKFKYLNK